MLSNRLQLLPTIVILFVCSWLTACHTLSVGRESVSSLQARSLATEYLQSADQAASPAREIEQLRAARVLVDAQLYQDAELILQQMNARVLPPDLTLSQRITQAQIILNLGEPRVALAKLTLPAPQLNTMPTTVVRDYYRVLADAYQRAEQLARSVQTRMALASVLTNADDIAQNDQAIWGLLQTLSPSVLIQLATVSTDPQLIGWVQLALLLNDQQHGDPQMVLASIRSWQLDYPNHPANQWVPDITVPEQAKLPVSTSVKQIALLLPLSGKLASSGDAVRNGFLTTYYVADRTKRPQIKIYDTAALPKRHSDQTADSVPQANVVSVYRRALAEGADVVIGPLTKTNIHALVDANVITVPTIGLNTIDDANTSAFSWFSNQPEQLYQFGLSPRDEATQVAYKAWQQGKRRALVVAPDTAWGQGVIAAFNQAWQSQGGEVVQSLYYNDQKGLSNQVKAALNVDQSNARHQALKKMLSEKIKTIPRRRQDVDMIFVAAEPRIARQLLPLFKFHYAERIPVYAISNIYSGKLNRRADNDLNGIVFCDIPLLLDNQPQYRQQRQRLRALWSGNYQQRARLYGLGMDAYTLITQLNRLALSPQMSIEVNTGRLSLTDDRHIYRTLMWAQIKKGRAVPLSAKMIL